MRKPRAAALPTFLCLAVLACDRGTASTPTEPSSTPAPPPAPPVLVMDSRHNQTMGGNEAYVIAPSAAVTLDPRGAALWETPSHPISLVEIVPTRTPNDTYRARWDARAPVTLDASSVSAARGASRFTGFADGESYLLAVGGELPLPSGEGTRVGSTWLAKLEVRSDR